MCKVGNFVRSRIENLISSGRLPEDETERLCDRAYCRAVFQISYPVLQEVSDACAQETKKLRYCCRDANGHLRYYVKAYQIHGKSFILSNGWREHPHRNNFQKWLQKFYEN